MAISIRRLNAMPAPRAAGLLAECCGSPRWVSAMIARRPFASREAVKAVADEVWKSLDANDWLQAFASHPRIGERPTAAAQQGQGGEWAADEQSGVDRAGKGVRAALADANRAYEERFGHIYIVCATGRTADEMLALAQARLQNSPAGELKVAAEEQRKITRLRLDKLLDKEDAQ
ncbi:MAG TPA: 2-oxo-4-hydroxy-4-carboxy-5-ureidoimidazoline decarboxylase [Gemmatimonadaceae bacterium]